MNSFRLSRDFFDFCFENPEKINTNHIAIYFFAIEHCNRLGNKEKFGFPTTMAMEAIGIKSYNTFISAFNDLVNFGFIKLIEKSKNQYSANIIALSNFNKALAKALDKALIKHTTKQSESTSESNCSIIKQETNKQETNKQKEFSQDVENLILFSKQFFSEKYLNDNSKDIFRKLIEIDKYSTQRIKLAIKTARTDNFWSKNFLSPMKLREKNKSGVMYIDVFLELNNNVNAEQKITAGPAPRPDQI